VTLAGVVSNWYFYRHEPEHDTSKDIASLSLFRATTNSLGTICLGSLILSTIEFLQWTNYLLRKITKGNNYFCCLSAWLSFIDGIIGNLNNYALIYAGISGESFYTSAIMATKLFHRNLIPGLENDVVTKIVLYIGSIIVALLCGFATFIYAVHSLQSSYGYVAGIFAAIIPYYISQFYTHLMMNTVDAAFLCYAIDFDMNKNHCNKAHEAFYNFNIQ
ncbi:18086_t:CDS:2, partial [Acaulospora morrowiae]